MADESTGFGSTIKIANSSDVLTELENIVEWPELPSFESELLDTTNFKTTGGYKTFMGGPLKEGTESDFVMNLVLGSTTDLLCQDLHASGEPRAFEMTLVTPSGTHVVTGDLVARAYVRTNPLAELRQATLTVKWSGAATETPGV